MASLYIVATPIGNLQDITLRALEVLKSVDCILCEDTRMTKRILDHYEIKTPTMSYHQHSGDMRVSEIRQMLEEGKNLALVTDAGTPGISDPGNELVKFIANSSEPIVVVPIPGASAVISALSVSGFRADKFLFLGFPPNKNKRKKFFESVRDSEHTVVFYESNHRIMKALEMLAELLDGERQVVVARELTKQFETVYRGTVQEVIAMKVVEKGEFVVVVEGSRNT